MGRGCTRQHAALLEQQQLQTIQHADKIYNIQHIDEANFGFLTGKRAFRPLVHRSGLNARVVVGGSIRVGDEIAPVERANLPAPLVTANEQTPVEAAPEVI